MKVYRAIDRLNTLDNATMLAIVKLLNVRYNRIFVTEWAVSTGEVEKMNEGIFLRHHGVKYIKLPIGGELYINDTIEGYLISMYKTKDTGKYVCIEICNETYECCKDRSFCYKYIGEV